MTGRHWIMAAIALGLIVGMGQRAMADTILTYDLLPETAKQATGEAEAGVMKRICSKLRMSLDGAQHFGVEVRANGAKQIEIVIPDRPGMESLDAGEAERVIAMMGRLSFHVAVQANEMPNAKPTLEQLAAGGPKRMRDADKDYLWVRIDDPARYTRRQAELQELKKNTAVYFAKCNLIGAEYEGEYYLLLWNKAGKTMADLPGQANWNVGGVAIMRDSNGGKAVKFHLDQTGGKMMAEMTGQNIGRPLAMVVGGRIFSPPPTIQTRLGDQIQMTGGAKGFSDDECKALATMLGAGRTGSGVGEEPNKVEIFDGHDRPVETPGK